MEVFSEARLPPRPEDNDRIVRASSLEELLERLHVGDRIAVWWPLNDEYFSAEIDFIDPSRPEDPFFIQYDVDEGDESQWYVSCNFWGDWNCSSLCYVLEPGESVPPRNL